MRCRPPFIKDTLEALVDRVAQRRRDAVEFNACVDRSEVGQRSKAFGHGDVRAPGSADPGGPLRVTSGVSVSWSRSEEATAVSARGHLAIDPESQLGLLLDDEMDQVVRHVSMTGCGPYRHVGPHVEATVSADADAVPPIVDPLEDHMHSTTLDPKRTTLELFSPVADVAGRPVADMLTEGA